MAVKVEVVKVCFLEEVGWLPNEEEGATDTAGDWFLHCRWVSRQRGSPVKLGWRQTE